MNNDKITEWFKSMHPESLARCRNDRVPLVDHPEEILPLLERFTDRARKVLALANQEAQRFNHEYVGTEHILLGLVKEGSGVAANVLKNLDVDLRKIRLEIEKIVQPGPDSVIMGKLPYTPRSKKVLEFAIEEAKGLGHNYIGTEHVLLGVIREHDGVAAQVLMNLGLKLEDVREELLDLLGVNPAAVEENPFRARKYNIDPAEMDEARKNILGYTLEQARKMGVVTPPGSVDDKIGKDKARLLEIAHLLAVATDPEYALTEIKRVILKPR